MFRKKSCLFIVFYFLISDLSFAQNILRFYYADTTQVASVLSDFDDEDSLFYPKKLYSDNDTDKTYSENNKYLNDTTILEVYRDILLKNNLITRISCKDDSVYIRYFFPN